MPLIKYNWVCFFIIGLSIISIFFILYSIKRCLSLKCSIVQSAKDKYRSDGKIICIKKHKSKKQKYVLVPYKEYIEFKNFKKKQKNTDANQSI